MSIWAAWHSVKRPIFPSACLGLLGDGFSIIPYFRYTGPYSIAIILIVGQAEQGYRRERAGATSGLDHPNRSASQRTRQAAPPTLGAAGRSPGYPGALHRAAPRSPVPDARLGQRRGL